MTKRTALRVGPIPMHKAKIDRQNLTIQDAVAMQVGEARGHDLWADLKTLQMVATLGNQASLGIKGRMGHPGMSDNAFAQEIMRANNFQVVGDSLRHDIKFYEWAQRSPKFTQDPVKYILDRAEDNPESFGESVVVWIDGFWVKADGTELNAALHDKPEDALYEFPSMRPKEFYYVDFVTDGALTPNGLFSSEDDFWRGLFVDGNSSEYSERAFALLNEFQSQYRLDDETLALKIPQLLNKYRYWKGFQMQEENKAPEVVEENELSAAFAEGENLLAEFEASQVVESQVESSQESSRILELEADLAQLKQALGDTREELGKMQEGMASYVKRMNEAFAIVQKKLAALASEPVETKQVGVGSSFNKVLSSPVPSANFFNQKPQSFDARKQNALAEGTPTDFMSIAMIEDPVERNKAIEAFNAQANAFGFKSAN